MLVKSMVEAPKKRSPLWYELPLLFSVIGGLVAYFMIRKDDPKKARNCLLLSVILLVIPVVIFLSFQIGLGMENPFYVVASGSMIPELEVYDVTVIQGHSTIEDVRIGDIIVFNRPSGTDRVILHRVVSITDDDPVTLRTKGDNNVASIPGTDYPITEKEYIGKVEYTIPQLGYVTQFLKPSTNFFVLLVYVIIPVILHFRFKNENSKEDKNLDDV